MKMIIKAALLLAAIISFSSMTASAAESKIKVYNRNIASTGKGFHKELRVEAPEYKKVSLGDIELEHAKRVIDGEDVEILHVKGRVENMSDSFLSGIKVEARLLDANGKVLASGYDGVLPRILRQKDSRVGTFSVKMPYVDGATMCEVDLSWAGKR